MLHKPSPDDPTRELADWIEMLALIRGTAGQGEIRDLVQAAQGRSPEEENDELKGGNSTDEEESESDEITEEEEELAPLDGTEERILEVLEELDERKHWAGSGYPFSLHGGVLRRHDHLRTRDLAYVAALLISRHRHREESWRTLLADEADLERLFHVCAMFAAAGFVGGPAKWIEARHPQNMNIWQKLAVVGEGVGAYEGTPYAQQPEHLLRQPQDGGIDVIAWRPMPDGLPGQIIFLGQSGSGATVFTKPVKQDAINFLLDFFSLHVGSPFSYGTFMPFDLRSWIPLVGSTNKPEKERAAIHRRGETLARGIIFDRYRLAYHFVKGLTVHRMLARCGEDITGAELLPTLEAWIRSNIDALRVEDAL